MLEQLRGELRRGERAAEQLGVQLGLALLARELQRERHVAEPPQDRLERGLGVAHAREDVHLLAHEAACLAHAQRGLQRVGARRAQEAEQLAGLVPRVEPHLQVGEGRACVRVFQKERVQVRVLQALAAVQLAQHVARGHGVLVRGEQLDRAAAVQLDELSHALPHRADHRVLHQKGQRAGRAQREPQAERSVEAAARRVQPREARGQRAQLGRLGRRKSRRRRLVVRVGALA